MYPERVRELASSLPRVHSLDGAVALLESFGITVHFFEFVDIQGVCLVFLGKPYVAVNRRLRECEKVFVLLHELGHFLLHADNQLAPRFFGHEFLEAQEEREADAFALLLMGEGLREDLENPGETGWAE